MVSRTVLLMITPYSQPRLEGISRFARAHGWNLMMEDRLLPDEDPRQRPYPEYCYCNDKNRKHMTARERLSRGVFLYDRRRRPRHFIGTGRVDFASENADKDKRDPGHQNSRYESGRFIRQVIYGKINEQKRIQQIYRFRENRIEDQNGLLFHQSSSDL